MRSRLRNSWDADDLTTTVFLKAYEKRHQCQSLARAGAWTFRIAHNTFIDFTRKKKEYLMDTDQENYIPAHHRQYIPEDEAMKREMLAELHTKMNELSNDQRNVLTLRFFAELKMADIADILGPSESAVKMISYRGLHQLKKMMEEGDPYE